ncbi:Uncharacterised protein [Moraxella caviae]|nr:Uncharacterised protein [Moraxella caviae]VEW11220.1 Uncharacterised protein [Moraxella caviae]
MKRWAASVLHNGQVMWLDTPPQAQNAKVIITVVDEALPKLTAKRQLGFMQGEMVLPDDINAYDDEVAKLFDGEIC